MPKLYWFKYESRGVSNQRYVKWRKLIGLLLALIDLERQKCYSLWLLVAERYVLHTARVFVAQDITRTFKIRSAAYYTSLKFLLARKILSSTFGWGQIIFWSCQTMYTKSWLEKTSAPMKMLLDSPFNVHGFLSHPDVAFMALYTMLQPLGVENIALSTTNTQFHNICTIKTALLWPVAMGSV